MFQRINKAIQHRAEHDDSLYGKLLFACRTGNHEIVRVVVNEAIFLNKPLDVTSKLDGATPLILAAKGGFTMIVRSLLVSGLASVDFKEQSEENHTALWHVTMEEFSTIHNKGLATSYQNIALILIEQHANPQYAWENCALLALSFSLLDMPQELKTLRNFGVEINARDAAMISVADATQQPMKLLAHAQEPRASVLENVTQGAKQAGAFFAWPFKKAQQGLFSKISKEPLLEPTPDSSDMNKKNRGINLTS